MSDTSIHSAESSALRNIKMVAKPLNFFRTQIILTPAQVNEKTATTIFPRHERFEIKYNTEEYMIQTLKRIMKPKIVTAFHTNLETWHNIKEKIANIFSTYFKVFTQTRLHDITEQINRENILDFTHKRAHRNALNNYKEILETCYWPTLKKDTENVVKNCTNCTENKYERHPVK